MEEEFLEKLEELENMVHKLDVFENLCFDDNYVDCDDFVKHMKKKLGERNTYLLILELFTKALKEKDIVLKYVDSTKYDDKEPVKVEKNIDCKVWIDDGLSIITEKDNIQDWFDLALAREE